MFIMISNKYIRSFNMARYNDQHFYGLDTVNIYIYING